ncbi:alpha/beta fold hydrolase [Nocardia huaxiensis]|uniref:alpha/beta fold hydrolase n=1 Tax=Nocardia huaxiensis TaxID=2755382 RepID=UPI001E33E8DC|nr:alpha/beta hydrolase [Nocardia huaxiensis]UFS96811.1 alpha/beta hydrolase [Nocardia huaxiensis]
MAKIGRFTSNEAKAAYLRAYDDLATDWPVPSTDLDVETSFGTTRVRKSGTREGAPLMLLPGMPGNLLFWMPFIEELSRDRVVYTLDVIGWPGRCEPTAPVRDHADIVRWLTEVFDGLGANHVHLAGYSDGAWIAGLFGTTHSERRASLSMLEPGGATFAKPRWSLLLKFLLAGMRPTRENMRKLTQWLTPGLELTDQEWAMALAGFKFRLAMPWPKPFTDEQLAAITAPLMVLFGGTTVVNDPEIGVRRLREHAPAADVETYPGVGHELLWAKTELVIPRLLNFVGSNEPVRA